MTLAINKSKRTVLGVVPPRHLRQRAQSSPDSEQLSDIQLRNVFNAMPAGVILLDEHGQIALANDAANAMLDESLEGQSWRDVIHRVFRPQKDDGFEVSLKNGRKTKISISNIPGKRGQLIHLTDLTETRALQAKVSHMQKLYSLGKMVASLAHQVRTPLSAAMLYAANLCSPTLALKARQKFSQKLVERLGELESQVNDMLLFARSDENQIVETIKVDDFLKEIIKSNQEYVRDHQCTLEYDGFIQSQSILGNRTALKGAIDNLIHNAVEIGGKETHVAITSRLESESHIAIEVHDNGPGISAALQSQIFEPFYTTRSQGTGLGLAVVKSVMKSHQGDIQVYNRPEKGACFRMVLPLRSTTESNLETPHWSVDLNTEQATSLPSGELI